MLKDPLAPALQLFDQEDRRENLLRTADDADFGTIQASFNDFSHKVWADPDPSLNDLRYDNAKRAKEMLLGAGLTTNWILGGDV